ncbi:hypothetical protein EDD86DRAFT_203566 [Gorgonomyces haynaldii]|nr:hypothetical protein EDD86DRAFT_203566 [Gorgonomyces haynaldii]
MTFSNDPIQELLFDPIQQIYVATTQSSTLLLGQTIMDLKIRLSSISVYEHLLIGNQNGNIIVYSLLDQSTQTIGQGVFCVKDNWLFYVDTSLKARDLTTASVLELGQLEAKKLVYGNNCIYGMGDKIQYLDLKTKKVDTIDNQNQILVADQYLVFYGNGLELVPFKQSLFSKKKKLFESQIVWCDWKKSDKDWILYFIDQEGFHQVSLSSNKILQQSVFGGTFSGCCLGDKILLHSESGIVTLDQDLQVLETHPLLRLQKPLFWCLFEKDFTFVEKLPKHEPLSPGLQPPMTRNYHLLVRCTDKIEFWHFSQYPVLLFEQEYPQNLKLPIKSLELTDRLVLHCVDGVYCMSFEQEEDVDDILAQLDATVDQVLKESKKINSLQQMVQSKDIPLKYLPEPTPEDPEEGQERVQERELMDEMDQLVDDTQSKASVTKNMQSVSPERTHMLSKHDLPLDFVFHRNQTLTLPLNWQFTLYSPSIETFSIHDRISFSDSQTLYILDSFGHPLEKHALPRLDPLKRLKPTFGFVGNHLKSGLLGATKNGCLLLFLEEPEFLYEPPTSYITVNVFTLNSEYQEVSEFLPKQDRLHYLLVTTTSLITLSMPEKQTRQVNVQPEFGPIVKAWMVRSLVCLLTTEPRLLVYKDMELHVSVKLQKYEPQYENLVQSTMSQDGIFGMDAQSSLFFTLEPQPRVELRLYDHLKVLDYQKQHQLPASTRNKSLDTLFKQRSTESLPERTQTQPQPSSTLNHTQQMLNERGERLEELEVKFSKLSDSTRGFLDQIKQYNEKESKKKWWQI